MTRLRRTGAVLGLALAAIAFLPGPAASAHPLGNFTVNVYAGIRLSEGRVTVDYVVDMAEIPTFQEYERVDADGDGTAQDAERTAWADAMALELVAGVRLAVDGRDVALAVDSAWMELRPGQGGLQVLRLEAVFAGAAPASGTLEFADRNYPGRVGWREVTASGQGRRVIDASVPVESVSRRLQAYPDGLLSSPPNVTEARVEYEPGSGEEASGATRGEGPAPVGPGSTGGAFAGLVARVDLSPLAVALSLLAALGLGALHALAPGHGKALMAGYLVGAGGRLRQAIGAATAVAAMHTVSVVAIGLAILSAERAFAPERLYPWLGLVSGMVALGLGTGLLLVRSRRVGRPHVHADGPHSPGPQARGHDHSHAHSSERLLTGRGLATLALSGGILPSPTAVIVLLGSVALGRVGFGLALIAAFGVGVAVSLVAVGVAAVRLGDVLAGRFSTQLGHRLPLAGAAVVVAAGLVLTARAAFQLV